MVFMVVPKIRSKLIEIVSTMFLIQKSTMTDRVKIKRHWERKIVKRNHPKS